MTPTDWLLLAIALTCLTCLVALIFAKMINTEWNKADEPQYRTADANAIRQQTHRVIANASAHKGTHTGVPASAPTAIHPNMQTTRREGTAAAIADLGRKPGTPAVPSFDLLNLPRPASARMRGNPPKIRPNLWNALPSTGQNLGRACCIAAHCSIYAAVQYKFA